MFSPLYYHLNEVVRVEFSFLYWAHFFQLKSFMLLLKLRLISMNIDIKREKYQFKYVALFVLVYMSISC